MAKNRQQLDVALENISKLYAYIEQQGAQIAYMSKQLKVLQDNYYALYKRLEEQEVTVVDTPNPTTSWGGKDDEKV